MMNPVARRSVGLIAKTSRNLYRPPAVCANWQQTRLRSTSDNLPKIVQPSIWTSIVPKFLRSRGPQDANKATTASQEWNPATFFIVIFVMIGSQAIQLLTLRKDFQNYTRRADAKLQLLREVIQRLQNGEHVDVEKLLGTGDEAKEREWEEGWAIILFSKRNWFQTSFTDVFMLLGVLVLREIEQEDSLWRQKSAKNGSAVTDATKSKDERTESVSDHTSGDTSKQRGDRMIRFY
jgi:hypothetical protein